MRPSQPSSGAGEATLDLCTRQVIVDVYVGYLRRKLGKDLITSIRGMGYRFEKDERRTAS